MKILTSGILNYACFIFKRQTQYLKNASLGNLDRKVSFKVRTKSSIWKGLPRRSPFIINKGFISAFSVSYHNFITRFSIIRLIHFGLEKILNIFDWFIQYKLYLKIALCCQFLNIGFFRVFYLSWMINWFILCLKKYFTFLTDLYS